MWHDDNYMQTFLASAEVVPGFWKSGVRLKTICTCAHVLLIFYGVCGPLRIDTGD